MSNKSVNLLKTNTNTIAHELIYTAIKCDVNANIYREYSGYLSLCSNLIAFPLIILTSVLGIVSTMQTVELEDKDNDNYLHTNSKTKIVISILSIFVAIMSGLQKYCKFAERTEITKGYAKNFEKLGHSIENFLYEIKNNTISTQTEIFDKLITNIFKDFEVLITECDDQPSNMADKQYKLFDEKAKILVNNADQDLSRNNQNKTDTDTDTDTNTTYCCRSMTNCLSFLCNCFEYDYDKNKHPEYKSTLIPLNNLDVIINNLKTKYRRPVIQPQQMQQPQLHPISRVMPPIITMYPIINNN
tara:strand:- start:388 stop:1290 length:903 start_codon:yes stop_codon:yes gene_type:complete